MTVHTDFTQGSDRWREVHLGRPTASEFERILSPVQRKFSTQHVAWAEELALERVTGGFEDVKPIFSKDIERGMAHEPRMLSAYKLHTGLIVRTVGFVSSDEGPEDSFAIHNGDLRGTYRGRAGCSPDGLVYANPDDPYERPIGGVEGKCPKLSKFLRWHKEGVLPAEHRCQVHGCLIVSKLPWWDFVGFNAYCPEKTLIIRVVPDDFTEALRDALAKFHGIVDETTEAIRRQLAA